MSDTPQDVRTIAARALHAAECSETNCVAAPEKLHWNLADAVLAAVSPVIRQQALTEAAERWDRRAVELREYGDEGLKAGRLNLGQAWEADCARRRCEDVADELRGLAHSTQPEEGTGAVAERLPPAVRRQGRRV